MATKYQEIYQRSIKDAKGFWSEVANDVFWYKKPSANAAAIKAFIVNRVGDFGFAIGIFLIFFFYGTVNYNEVFEQTPLLSNHEIIFLGIEFKILLVPSIATLFILSSNSEFASVFTYATSVTPAR